MASNGQFSVTLDPYHRWAVKRVAKAMAMPQSDLILWAVRDWVTAHNNQVADSEATVAEFKKSKEAGESASPE
jgi:hypothetical protein